MSEVSFDHLHSVHFVWLALMVGALMLYGLWQRRRGLRRFAASGLILRLAPLPNWLGGSTRAVTVTIALGLLAIALMGPRWGESQEQIIRRNIDVMVVLDVSRSMLAEDIAPNRLERAKLAIREDLLPALGGDRIGLITFAGVARLACPLTTDYGFFRLALDDVSIQSAPRGGSLIGDAIRSSTGHFDSPLDTHKLIVLITDGEDQESYPIEAARGVWEDDQIAVLALALGDERDGTRIPIRTKNGVSYLQHDGETVWTKANFDDLRAIARIGPSNSFVPVGTRDFNLGDLYRRVVQTFDAEEQADSEAVPEPARFHYFALAALGLFLINAFWRAEGGGRSVARASQATQREAAG
jgi:Ca-activated chloride channel family protein